MNQQITTDQAMNALSQTRPDITAEWDPSRQKEVLQRLATTLTVTSSRPGRRWVPLLAGVAAVAALGLVVTNIPKLTPIEVVAPPASSAASASEASPTAFQQLAALAAARPANTIPEGEYLHVSLYESSKNSEGWTEEVYYSRDGSQWTQVDSKWTYTPGAELTVESPSPTFLETLPTDPAELLEQVRPAAYRAWESDGADKLKTKEQRDNVTYTYLQNALILGYAPPKVNAAMISAIELLDVEAKVKQRETSDGKACLGLVLKIWKDEEQVNCFDPETAEWMELHSFRITMRVVDREMVSELPEGAIKAQQR